MYIVYTITHKMFLFNDIDQARAFRKRGNEEGSVTWYIAEAPVLYGLDEGCETPAIGIDKPAFPR